MKLEFSGIDLEVTPTGDERQWYTTVEEAARAFGVARDSIKMNLSKHQDEIRHGIDSTGNNTPEAFTGLMDRLSDFDNKLEKLSNNLSRKIDKLNCVTTDEGE